ncbi:hypothetical protein ACIA8G_03185 [Lentzea sp. NPDC051213]|uniref:hypothetical protein n=1 Tax=Lentzea sp. NPDC051213 TaxID=3364126 RepID=UPI0037A43C2F
MRVDPQHPGPHGPRDPVPALQVPRPAWKIAAVRLGAAESLLESYHLERRAAALENIAVTSATMDFLVPRTSAAVRRREKALASGDPALIDSDRLAEPFWYTGSPLTTPDWREVPRCQDRVRWCRT